MYVIYGSIKGETISTCTGYCEAHGLRCLNAYEDETSDCEKKKSPLSCDIEYTKWGGDINFLKRVDLICSCGKIGSNT